MKWCLHKQDASVSLMCTFYIYIRVYESNQTNNCRQLWTVFGSFRLVSPGLLLSIGRSHCVRRMTDFKLILSCYIFFPHRCNIKMPCPQFMSMSFVVVASFVLNARALGINQHTNTHTRIYTNRYYDQTDSISTRRLRM